MDTKLCNNCSEEYSPKYSRNSKRWLQSKYCSPTCQRKKLSGWNKGKTGYMSEAGREVIRQTQKKYIENETPEQRKDRMAKVLENRNKNGNWKPPGTGKVKEQNYAWLGDKATYNAKHRWIQKHWQKTGKCEECGKEPKPYGRRKWGTEWSNQDGLYNREDRSTWRELCKPCHRAYDSVRK